MYSITIHHWGCNRVREQVQRGPRLCWLVSAWMAEIILPPALECHVGRLGCLPGDSTQGWPHHAISGSCFQLLFLLGLAILSEVNEIIVSSLPLNYHGCCSSFPTRVEEVHWGAWQPPGPVAPEPGFLRSGGFLRLSFRAPVWKASLGPACSSAGGSGQHARQPLHTTGTH